MNTDYVTTRNLDFRDMDHQHIWHHISRFERESRPFVIVKGKGLRVWDADGRSYLDAVAGAVWTVNVGYGRTEIADAIRDELVKMNYYAQTAGNIPAAMFAARLVEKMPGMSRVYYSNSGSEANEKAFKIVRQISQVKYGGKKYKILYRDRDYHGTTIAALSATGQTERREHYGPFVPGFLEVPHCCEYRAQPEADMKHYGHWAADEIERVILCEGPDEIGALCLEPITAGGGIIVPPAGYLNRVQEICRKYDILLHIDEVVCGMGRTGEWFGYQHYGVMPDIVTAAKGLASGYAAIALTITTEDVFKTISGEYDREPLNYFRDISTFAGCTAGPAAALVNMKIIEEEGLLENAKQQGTYLLQRLCALQSRHNIIGDVRGKGLLAGIELVADRVTKRPINEDLCTSIVARCRKNGVLIGRTNRSFAEANNCLYFAPGLIVTCDEIDEIIGAVDKSITECG